jgi:polar amino acid transport system ATP-binding protein
VAIAGPDDEASTASLRRDHLCTRPTVAAEVLEVLRRLKAEVAIALVTHDMSFASRAADRLVFFQDGEITVNTTPEIAFTQSDNKELNKFIEAVGF